MLYLRKTNVWSQDKRALSPIFATVLLAAIILLFGSVAYYYSSNATTTATNNYASTLSNSQQSIAERIGFENVVYSPSPANLTVYIINSGGSNSVKIDSMFIYDTNHAIVGVYSGSQISALYPITSVKPSPTSITGNALNIGKEALFFVNPSVIVPSLKIGSIYTIHLITQSGSAFDYEFTP